MRTVRARRRPPRRIGVRAALLESPPAPTVLADVPIEADVFNNEPFGPIVAIRGFDTLEDAIVEASLIDALLSQLMQGPRMDALALAKSCEALVKGDLSGTRLALLVDWLQRWALDLQLVRLGAAPMVFPEHAATFQKLASGLNDDRLSHYPEGLLEARRLCGHPLNIRLFLESVFSRTLALYEPSA